MEEAGGESAPPCRSAGGARQEDGGTSVPMETGVGDAHAAVSLSPGVPIRGIKMKFAVLRGLVEAGEVPDKDLVETVFSLLVGGQFDLEVNFIIQEAESVGCMVELLDQCEATCQVEMWSIFVAILKKSARNLQACTEVGLMELVLARIHEAHCTVADLLIDVLAVLARYSITVRQLKLLVSKLQGENGCWPPHAVKLLSVLKAAPHRVGPDAFFSFPGKSAAAIALPPIAKWPYHSGFTFHTWLRLDPVSSVSGEDKPYVYCFHTSKGLGYSAHFVGGCLIVTSLKSRGRGFQHCVKYDFRPQQWYMVTIVHVYNRWKNSEISCYVNGELASYGEITWLVSTSDTFDKCFLGSWETVDASRVFCGQMGAVYLFSEALSAAQILAVYHLGPGYKGTFRHRAECDLLFAEHHRTLLYDGKLSSCIAFTYNPRATDGQLCLESSPRDSPSVFVHSPHALMLQDVRDVSTHSVQSAIHSMGGVQVLFPLFAQLDYLQHSTDEVDTSVCHTLLSFLMELLRNSVSVQEQVLSCKAFLVIGYILEKSSKVHMTLSVLDIFLALARYLSSVPHGAPLLKQLCDYILFNPAIWVHAAAKVQTTLYTYLCTEFISTVTIYSAIRRVSTVLQVMHTLKYYYWVVNPQDRSGITPKGQGETDYLMLCVFVVHCFGKGAVLSVYVFILNYLLTMHEDDNLMDVLQLLVALIAEHPSSMVPAFDQRNGIRIVYKLLASESEGIRVQAIKVLGYFLTSLAPKRKADVMVGHSLFSLLSERLLLQTGRFTMSTYNVLFEILTEQIHTQVVHRQHPEPDSSVKILNPQILKVIAVLLKNSPQSPSSMELRRIFLSDMIRLFNNSRENRRSVLQCSVWQEWMLSLCYMHPNTSEEHKITEMVFAVFRILLYHAIKYERGGWRVWVDTLSIAHSKVRVHHILHTMSAFGYLCKMKDNNTEKEGGDEMKDVISQKLAKEERRESGDTFDIQKSVVEKVEPGNSNGVCPSKEPAKVKEMKITRLDVSSVLSDTERLQPREQLSLVPVQGSSSGRAAIFHSSEFQWSHLHQRLLGDVLFSIETDVQMWRSHSNRTLMDFVSSSDNAVYVHNTVHLLSHMLDNVITACGGILPLLSAATSSSHELENMEPSQGLSPAAASSFLQRVMALADVLLLSNTLSFVEVEAEKNMGSGGILRQCLRLVCAVAVCSCLEQQRHSYNKCNTESASGHGALQSITGPSTLAPSQDPVDIFTSGVSLVREMDSLLQDVDIHRLRAAVFKDIENSKQAHHMALAVIYFISVLMVSKYRDILEPHRERELLQRSQSTESREVASSSSLRRSDSGVASLGATSPSGPDATNEVLPALSSEVNQSQESFPSPAPSPLHSTKFTNVKEILRSLVSSPAEDILVDPRLLPPAFLGDAGDVVVEPAVQFRSFDRWASRWVLCTFSFNVFTCVSRWQLSCQHLQSSVFWSHTGGEPASPTLPPAPTVCPTSQDPASSMSISEKLEQALEGAAALLRDIFVDFAPFLSRTLLGSHGQELLAEGTGLLCMKSSGSVVELVMLLCSQEWQCSIQKNAGVAFIDLVNEGRLLSRAMKEHLVRVANEAKFILSRQHNDDVHKHAEFESQCAQYAAERRGEEKLCDNLIRAARYRDHVMATQLIGKILHILTDKHGAWGSSALSRPRHFWRLDSWEDDLRRRRRFVRNPFGSSHPEATLKAARENGPEEDVLRGQRSIKKPSVGNATWESELLVDGDDEALSSLEDKDVESPAGAVILSTDAHLVAPAATLRGTLSISASELYFEVDEEDPAFRRTDPQVLAYTEGLHGKWLFTEIRAIFSRRYLLQNTALEIFLANRTAVMFNFADQTTVKKVVQRLPCVGVGTSYGLPQSRRVSLARPKQLFKESNMTERWQRRDISNFEYLMFLNTISGRTYCDLSQYPVFPWVISNYESEELDLTSPSNFRDLSKPVGVLNPRRAAYFSERYDSWEDKEVPKFHYGTHYSTSGFTQMWLLRVEPFATFFLNFQGGKFDHADRTFSSMSRAWRNCQEDTCDVKELIPEFYYLPEMFVNSNDFNLGVMDDGTVVSDVELPPWASTPEEFVRISRMALESEIVSSQLHLWIDLIFGYRQQGPEAVKALNVFYYLTYEGAVDLGSIGDPKLREAVEAQIRSFGQTPCQLLQDPHPARSPATQRVSHGSPHFLEHPQQDVLMVLKFPSNSPVVHVAASTQPGPSGAAVITVTASRLFAVNKWHGLAVHQGSSVPEQQYQLPVEMDPLIASHTGTPRRQITDLLDQSVQMHTQCFVVTADHRFLLACGFWDDSFRVYAVDSGKLTQVVFGHRDVVTCLARSESYAGGHCYVLSGSRDATLLLWYWNGRNCSIGEGNFVTPRAVMTGHDREVTCASVCAELGLVVSGCEEGPFLIHSMTGELLRALEGPAGCLRPRLVQTSSEGHCVVHYDGGHFCTFDINGKLLAHGTMEESIRTMLLSRDGQHLVSGGDRGVLTVWRTHDLKQLFAYPGCDAGIRSMALSHDQRCVIAGMASGSIVLFYNDFSRWRYDHQFKYCS
uniref:LPS-responsive vesicle trafficking, beach and anchor containing n=1 Tax=Scleropages formosus TaxID=113540 RepID=A0A8C9U6A5_SCLFO